MCRKEIFAGIIEKVALAAETTPSVILSRLRTAEAVDARCAFVRIASEQGYYPTQIAAFMGRTAASVRYLLTASVCREQTCKQFANILKTVRKQLASN